MSTLYTLFMAVISAAAGLFVTVAQPHFTTDLSAIQWDDGVPIVVVRSVAGEDSGTDVLSGDGNVHQHFSVNAATEFLSPQKLLIADTSLFYITPATGHEPIQGSTGQSYQRLSLSPLQDYLEYDSGDSTKSCVSSFDYTTLGPCVDLTALLPKTWNWNTEAYIDTWNSNWDKTTDHYIIRVRSKLLYDLVQSKFDGSPAQQVQRELARFSYDPVTQTLSPIPLDTSIVLKTPDIFLTPPDQAMLNYFQSGSDYEITYNYSDSSIGITKHSTNQAVKLINASFIDEMPEFDVITYKHPSL